MSKSVSSSKSPVTAKRWNKWLGGCLFLLILPISISYGLFLRLRRPLPTDPQLIAHRGAHKGKSADLPENTLAAFREAIGLGADWLEFDVQMSRDGFLVVIHDETVDRTTNGTGRVEDLTLEEIRALDAGNGEPVPRFDEVLALAMEAGIGLLPELKSPRLYPGIEAKVLEAIVEAGYVDRTGIQSFDPTALENVRALYAEIRLCPLYGPGVLSLSGLQPGQARTVCPMAEMVLLNPWMLNQAHDEGLQVYVWFGLLEHPLVMRLLLALGVDGLMVDNPAALAEILNR